MDQLRAVKIQQLLSGGADELRMSSDDSDEGGGGGGADGELDAFEGDDGGAAADGPRALHARRPVYSGLNHMVIGEEADDAEDAALEEVDAAEDIDAPPRPTSSKDVTPTPRRPPAGALAAG